MKKPNTRELINLICSAFLILGFVVCAYFFSAMTGSSLSDNIIGKIVYLLIFVLFGLILFYATRVGDGKQIKRFNIASLILVCLPAIYVILAYLFDFMPLHAQLSANNSVAVILASIAFGYGIPYTFLSGYEIKADDEEAAQGDETEEASADSEDVDYSEIKTLDLEAPESEEADEDAEEDNKADSEDNKEESDDEISEDTAKTIQSVLDEKN
ncbi:MAG: hypothetical protein ACI4F2_08715 [Acutalibacteraceae bacterium]